MPIQKELDSLPYGVIGVLGLRGSGKTYLSSKLDFSKVDKVFYLDTVGAFSKNFREWKNEKEFLSRGEFLILNFSKLPDKLSCIRAFDAPKEKHVVLNIMTLPSRDMVVFVDWLCEYLKWKKKPCALVADEVGEFCDQERVNYSYEFESVVRIGRNLGILWVVLISQRPQKVNKNIFTQCDIQVIFKLYHNLDIGAVQSILGHSRTEFSPVAEKIKRMGIGDYLMVKNGYELEWNSGNIVVSEKDASEQNVSLPVKIRNRKMSSEDKEAILRLRKTHTVPQIVEIMGFKRSSVLSVVRDAGEIKMPEETREKIRKKRKERIAKKKGKR
jgi:hypothetical protein